MPTLTIDNREVKVPDGATILDAARKLGIDIPTLCFLDGYSPWASCFVCVVEVVGQENLVPSCATRAEAGMDIRTGTPEVLAARRTALELLLSDHVGDCVGPCQSVCPAHMNIPQMIRQIAAGDQAAAVATIKKDIALPAVLGRICPAPCENHCRRRDKDNPVAIRLLKRCVADADLAADEPYLPPCRPANGKKVAVIGAGPTGLAAAYYLLIAGTACTLFDEHDRPGGMLRYGVAPDRLPRDVLDAEIAAIGRLRAEFRTGAKIADEALLANLRKDFDAVVLAVGRIQRNEAERLGLTGSANGVRIDPRTYETSVPGVFAGGGAVRPGRLAVRAAADGKGIAESVDQYLSGLPVTGPARIFSTHVGALQEGEIELFCAGASESDRIRPAFSDGGFSAEEARDESLRCLHCDCRKADNCKLRDYSAACDARVARYKSNRRRFEQHAEGGDVIYEPGKCIACGLCVQITERAAEPLGLTFIGRGFDVRVGVPFGESIAEGLRKTAAQCAAACPTGALALKETT